jgi:hypothetical protein
MAEIITEEEAKLSLRLGDTLDDTDQADLTLAIAQAEGIYFTYNPESQWDDTSPATDTIWDNRGEDPLPKAYDLMRLNRGPALA